MPFLVNCRSADGAAAPWKNFLITHTTPIDISGDGTWTVHYEDGFAPVFDSPSLGGWPPTGDAAWVNDQNAAQSGHRCETEGYNRIVISGPTNTAFSVECYAHGLAGRVIEIWLNGGTRQSIDIGTTSETLTFTGTTDGSGVATLEYGNGPGSAGPPYLNAFQITPVPGPTATLDSDLSPGAAITGSYANFPSDPTTLTLTDSQGNSISSAVEITDLVIDTGAETFSFTMPALPTSGSQNSILMENDIQVELT